MPDPHSPAEWKRDRSLVRECHDNLVEAVASFDASRLDDRAGADTRTTCADLITGIVLHDTYHVGQIQMLKRLARSHGL